MTKLLIVTSICILRSLDQVTIKYTVVHKNELLPLKHKTDN